MRNRVRVIMMFMVILQITHRSLLGVGDFITLFPERFVLYITPQSLAAVGVIFTFLRKTLDTSTELRESLGSKKAKKKKK